MRVLTGRRRGRRGEERPRVPGYELLEPVGFGATGAVWSVRDRAGRPAVLSLLDLPDGERGAALLRRLGALRTTAHPHLPAVRDVVGLTPGRCAVVCEEVTGPTLATVRTAGGDLSPAAGRLLLTALGGALGSLHERGVVHGDVSPENVILTAGGIPVLVDLAGEVTHERGTAGFLAPERRAGAAAGPAADVWALGQLVLWACGEHPETVRAVSGALAAEPGERPAARELALIAAGMGTEPVPVPDRADLAQARLRGGRAATRLTPARRPRARHRRRRRWRPALLAMTAVLAGAGGAVALPTLTDPADGTSQRGDHSNQQQPVQDGGTRAGGIAGAGVAAAGRGGVDDAGVEALVEDLLAARDEALAASDAEALARLTVPGGEPARQDAELLARLAEAGLRPEGLETVVEEVGPVEEPSPGQVRAEVVIRQLGYTLTPAGERAGAEGREVPTQESRCVLMTLERGDGEPPLWRLAVARPCA